MAQNALTINHNVIFHVFMTPRRSFNDFAVVLRTQVAAASLFSSPGDFFPSFNVILIYLIIYYCVHRQSFLRFYHRIQNVMIVKSNFHNAVKHVVIFFGEIRFN